MQTIKAQKTKYSGKALAVTAMFAALITAATAFIKIPAPLGYAHAGDSVIYLAACILPAPFGFIAASVGGALADLLSGYAVWAIPTAVIKAATRAFCIRSPLPCCCPPQPLRQSATLPPTWFCTTQLRLGRRCRSIWCSQPSAPFCLSPWHSRSTR